MVTRAGLIQAFEDENRIKSYFGPEPSVLPQFDLNPPVVGGFDTQQAVNQALGTSGDQYSDLFTRIDKPVSLGNANGPTAMQKFISAVKSDRGRLNKPFLYEATIYNQLDTGLVEKMTLYCNSAAIPGYTTEVKRSRIYGLDYEVPINLEQDPVWMEWYADINYKIPNMFLDNLRQSPELGAGASIFDYSYSPRYKDDYALVVVINILDEMFNPVSTYVLNGCFFKAVNQVNLASDRRNHIQTITAQLSFERMAVFSGYPNPDGNIAKMGMADTTKGDGQLGTSSAAAGGDKVMGPENTKLGSILKAATGPFQAASASIAAVRNQFNSLGINQVFNDINSARRTILDPIHQLNESRALVTSTLSQINSLKSATTIELNQGKQIMSSFDQLF